MILKEPIPFAIEIPMAGGLNEYDDPTLIGDTEFQEAEKASFDRGIAEKAKLFEKLNQNALEGGAKIDGTCRCYANDGTSRTIVIVNGKIYESSDWVTPIYSGLTAGKRCSIVGYQGKYTINNGYDDPIVYNPKTNEIEGTAGINGPYQLLKVAYFELDEQWTGGQADEEIHVDDEYTGDSNRGRRLTASASSTESMELTGTLDFSKFGDDGSITNWDFIDISTFHQYRKTIQAITIYFETSTGNYYSFAMDKESLDPDEERDNEWTHHKIHRGRFNKTGSPSWSTITKIKISLAAESAGEARVTFDNWRIRKTPLLAGSFRKDIAVFEESEEAWSAGTWDKNNYEYGGMGLKLTDGTESAYLDKSLDLTEWMNGQSIFDSDEIVISAFVNNRSKISNVTIKLGDATLSNYFYKTWPQSDLDNGTDLWNELTVKRKGMSETGSPAWDAITRIQVEATISSGGEITFDYWYIRQKYGRRDIVQIEKGESGVNWNFSDSFIGWSKHRVGLGKWSVKFWRYLGLNDGEAKVKLDNPIDLSKWEDGSDSSDEDYIAFWHFWSETFGQWVETVLQIDCNQGNFSTDFYKFHITPGYLKNAQRRSKKYVLCPKKEFKRVGDTAGKDWSTVKAIRWKVECGGFTLVDGAVFYYIDHLHMRRSLGMTGRFQWKTVYRFGEIRSPASEATDWVDLYQVRALLTHIPISPDPRVKVREIYRREFGEEDFRLAFTIPDNTSTEWWDDIQEPGLTMDEMGVPRGTITSPKGAMAIEYRDSIIVFRILDDLKRAYHSLPGLIYAWSEDQARDYPSEAIGAVVHFDALYSFLRDGRVYRVEDDFDLGTFHPMGDIIKGVSPWGICHVEQNIAVLTEDDIKLFTGYESRSIGKPIAPYLDQENYKTEEGLLFYHKDHLYYAVETRAGGSFKLLDCYIPGIKWQDTGIGANCFCAYMGTGDKNELIMGSTDGFVYKLSNNYGDTLALRSKDFGEVSTAKGKGFLFHEKQLKEVRVIAKGETSECGQLTIEFFANGGSTQIFRQIPDQGHLYTNYHTHIITLQGVEKTIAGQLLGYKITHTESGKNPNIKAVMLYGDVIPLEQEFTDG